MNEITIITSALAAKQSLVNYQIGAALLKNAHKNEQALAQMIMETIRAGQTVINQSGSGTLDLYV